MSELIQVPQSVQDTLHANQVLQEAAATVAREDAVKLAGEIAVQGAAVGLEITPPVEHDVATTSSSQAGVQAVKFNVGPR